MKGEYFMEKVMNFLNPPQLTRVQAREVETQKSKMTEESFIGAIQNFFTENVNSIITACLIYFTLFAGFTRMKNKHLAVMVPTAAIWTVYQASALLIPLGGAASIIALAKAYFAWQGTSASTVARDTGSSVGQGLREAAASFASTEAVREGLSSTSTQGKKGGPSSEYREAAQTVFEQVQQQRVEPVRTSPPPTEPLLGGEHERFDFEDADRNELPSAPRSDLALESAWEDAQARVTTQREWANDFLIQHPDARQVVTTIPQDQLRMFDEAWGTIQRQHPGAKMSDPWVQEFMSQQAKTKGFPWGKIAKFAGVAVVGAAAGYGLYRLYQYVTAPQDEQEDKKEKKVEQKRQQPTAQDLGEKFKALPTKQKQALAMHLLFGKSKASDAFKAVLKKSVDASKASKPTSDETAHTPSVVAIENASPITTGETTRAANPTPRLISREQVQNAFANTQRSTPKGMDPKVARRLAVIAGNCAMESRARTPLRYTQMRLAKL